MLIKKRSQWGRFLNKTLIKMMVLSSLTLGLVGCGVRGQDNTSSENVGNANAETKQEDGGEDTSEVGMEKVNSTDITMVNCKQDINTNTSDKINGFSFEMYGNLQSDNNFFASPLSVYTALAILDNGATNDGKAEIEKALGITDIAETNEQLNSLMNILAEDEDDINISNSLWLDESYNFTDEAKTSFIESSKKYYNADSFSVNFTREDTYKKINEWVSNSTNGMIDPFIKDTKSAAQDGGASLLKIINAVYFDGKWENSFPSENTYESKFNGVAGTTNIDMMSLTNTYVKYIIQDGLMAASLPYKGNTMMDIIMSEDSSTTVNEVFSKLSTEEKSNFIKSLSETEAKELTQFAMPKFEYETEMYDLIPILRNMGINSIFDSGNCLQKISNDIVVDSLNHKAKIEVTEEGTKAAAVTEVGVSRMSILKDEITHFIVDRPFIFIIRDSNTNTILFIGEMNNLG